MTFFYSAIGILLFSSIVIVNKYLLLINNSNFSEPIPFYNDSKYKQIDQFFLSTLYSDKEFGYGRDICFNLKKDFIYSGISNPNDFEYIQDDITSSKHESIINSCVLTDGTHRILIKKNEYSPIKYSYNSCILEKKFICPFEEEAK